jgi:hypothetical protein
LGQQLKDDEFNDMLSLIKDCVDEAELKHDRSRTYTYKLFSAFVLTVNPGDIPQEGNNTEKEGEEENKWDDRREKNIW